MMFIHVDLFGGNPAIFLFLFTIPAGIVVFIVSLWLVNKFHNKSPVESINGYSDTPSEPNQKPLK